MHLLPLTRRNHIFQHAKLLVHLRSSSSLDQAVCCFPCNLASSGGRSLPRALLTAIRLRGRVGCLAGVGRSSLLGARLLHLTWLHLDDLARPRGRRRQGEVILCDNRHGGLGGALAWVVGGRAGRHRSIGRVRAVVGRSGRTVAHAIGLGVGCGREGEGRGVMAALFAPDIAGGSRGRWRQRARHGRGGDDGTGVLRGPRRRVRVRLGRQRATAGEVQVLCVGSYGGRHERGGFTSRRAAGADDMETRRRGRERQQVEACVARHGGIGRRPPALPYRRAGAVDGLNGESEAVACSSSCLPLAQSLIALSRHVLPSITATRLPDFHYSIAATRA